MNATKGSIDGLRPIFRRIAGGVEVVELRSDAIEPIPMDVTEGSFPSDIAIEYGYVHVEDVYSAEADRYRRVRLDTGEILVDRPLTDTERGLFA